MNRRARIILASAGSGKTWQLTTHLLKLLVEDEEPQRILASTFTRKAAAEILGRVFARLAAAAADDSGRRALDTALEHESSREAYAALLAKLVRDVHMFRVRTLDAFFVELAQAFAPELGLPPRWKIADEVEGERVLEAAFAATLEGGDPRELALLLRELQRNRDARCVRDTLSKVARLAHEVARESEAAAWDRVRGPEPMSAEELAAAQQFLEEWVVPVTAKGAPDKNWKKSLANSRAAVARADWNSLFKVGIGKCVLAGEETYCNRAIDEDLQGLFLDLARHAASDFAALIGRQNRATRRWLEAFEREYERGQRNSGAVRFSDLPHLLAGPREEGPRAPLDDLALRLDARIDHLLLDEFQDTSPAQWRVLAPIAEELAADGSGERSFFCVGDSKQSIYGWRAAEPRLFESLPARLHVEPESLAVSFRSSQIVLDAVNQVFGELAGHELFQREPADRRTAEEFQRAFQPHVAADPSTKGAVRIHLCEKDEDSAVTWRRVVERVVELVRELRRDAPGASVAVLTRKNAFAARIAKRLRDERIAASDEGGNPLTDSVAVQAALAFLTWLDHPGDEIARFHAASSVIGRSHGLGAATPADGAARIHAHARTALVERGLVALLAHSREAVAELGLWEARRYGQLIDLALAWSDEDVLRPARFCARVRKSKVEDPSTAQVKVMTIHAAKGLEFDAVIVPELDTRFVQTNDALVWERAGGDPAREIESVSRSVSATIRSLLARSSEPLLDQLHASDRARVLRDGLSALYVAMTRARHRLDLVVWRKGRDKFTPAELVRQAFGLELEPGALRALPGSDDAWMLSKRDTAADSREVDAPVRLRFAPSQRSRELEREQPSKLDPPRRVATRELFRAPDEAPFRRGLRFHAWLERVEWLDSVAFGRADLADVARRLSLGGERLEQDLDEFLAALERPRLRALLARPVDERGSQREVWRERRFRLVEGDKLETGAFDRVVVESRSGRPHAAHLIDFKTDRVAGSEALSEPVLASYSAQLSAYRRALARITGLPESAIRAELYFFEGDRTWSPS